MPSIDTAVVLAAGRGTRMGALTATTPKPLLAVAGEPIVARVLRGLARAGVRRAVVVTGYLGEQIEAALGDGHALGLALAYRRQERPDGTARALLLAEDLIGRVADKWTMIILELLVEHDTLRFTQLSRLIGAISQKMLTQTLRLMERDGLVTRKVYPVVPPKVEYSLTTYGRTLRPVLEALCKWGGKHRARPKPPG